MADYIDREKLLKSIPSVKDDKTISLFGAVADMICIVNSAPKEDVALVVHGTWFLRHIGHGHYWECSVCHATPIYVTNNTNYCPNCGAKMDMEQEEPINGKHDAE